MARSISPGISLLSGGGKGVLAALLAAEGSAHLLDRKLADSLSRKDLSPKLPPEAANPEKHSGIDILREAANQERAREQGVPGGGGRRRSRRGCRGWRRKTRRRRKCWRR